MDSGTLFVVATPIGNLADLSDRARSTLEGVALVAAEDTRHTGAMLATLGIDARTTPLHEHNEDRRVPQLLERLRGGDDIALVSDAGTPLLADPGFRLVRAATEAGLPVRPIPGPCAVTAALSVAGLPTDRFRFEGFLPAKAAARRARAGILARETATLVLFEAPHRIAAMLADLAAVFGDDRPVWVGRELTKQFEAHRHGTLGEVSACFERGEEPARGEFVVVVAGAAGEASADEDAARDLLRVLLDELPASRASKVAGRLTGLTRSRLYELAMELSGS